MLSTDSYEGEKWVDDDRLGYLKRGSTFVYGRWRRNAELWDFVPEKSVEALADVVEWDVLDSYWGERAELVLDSNRAWKRACYSDSDHDHCAICWETIGEPGQPEGYTTTQDEWVCLACYESFICTRSLGFITPQRSNHR